MKMKLAALIPTTALLVVCATHSVDASPTVSVTAVVPHGTSSIGTGPTEVAVDVEHHQAYVTNGIDDTVSVVDTRTNSVTSVIIHNVGGIGRAPLGVAVDEAHDQAYVTNYVDGTVSVIDTTTNEVKQVIRNGSTGIGDNPNGVAVDAAHNQAYVVDTINHALSVIDTTTNTVSTLITTYRITDGTPSVVAVDAAHHQAYVLTSGGTDNDEVVVINTDTNKAVSVIPHGPASIGNGADGIAVDAAHHQAYVTNYDDGTISVIDTGTNTVKKVIARGTESGPLHIAVDALSQTVYVSNEISGTVSVLDTKSNTIVAVLPNGPAAIGNSPEGIAVDDTGHAFVANLLDGTLSVIQHELKTPLFTSGAMPAGRIGASYAFTLEATGTPVPSFAVVPWSALLPGLTLNADTGVISGIPTRVGSYTTVVEALNGVAPADFASLNITVTPALRPGPVSW